MGTTPRGRRRVAILLLAAGGLAACEDPVRTASPPDFPDPGVALDRADDSMDANAPGVQLQTIRVVSAPPIVIDGPADSATVLMTSLMTQARSGVSWRMRVEQGATWADAGSGAIDCGAGAGVLPPGRCALRRLPFVAGHGGAHSGTLVPGAATLVFELLHRRNATDVEVGEIATTITLDAGAATGVVVTPTHYEFGAPGGVLQLSASVLPPSAPQGVQWSSSNAGVATVSSTGVVTSVAPGAALVTAQAASNPGAHGTSLISVGTTPDFDPGVNASPGAWDAVPGMQLRFAAQVVSGPQQVTWSSSNAGLVTISVPGQATAVAAPGSATLTARSVSDNTQFADVNVRLFSLTWRFPSTPTSVSTGAVSPPANPLSVQLQAQACQSTFVFSPPFQGARYEVLNGSTWVTIGQSSSFQVIDSGTVRCWVYPFTWTPGSAYGTGPQSLRATMVDWFNGLGSYAANGFVTITTP